MKVEAFFSVFCVMNLGFLYFLWKLVQANEARLERLERAKPIPTVKAPSPVVAQQTRQIEEIAHKTPQKVTVRDDNGAIEWGEW